MYDLLPTGTTGGCSVLSLSLITVTGLGPRNGQNQGMCGKDRSLCAFATVTINQTDAGALSELSRPHFPVVLVLHVHW